jgi:hypothetical protein
MNKSPSASSNIPAKTASTRLTSSFSSFPLVSIGKEPWNYNKPLRVGCCVMKGKKHEKSNVDCKKSDEGVE